LAGIHKITNSSNSCRRSHEREREKKTRKERYARLHFCILIITTSEKTDFLLLERSAAFSQFDY